MFRWFRRLKKEHGQSPLFWVLVILSVILFGLGFTVKWLLIVALVVLIAALFSWGH